MTPFCLQGPLFPFGKQNLKTRFCLRMEQFLRVLQALCAHCAKFLYAGLHVHCFLARCDVVIACTVAGCMQLPLACPKLFLHFLPCHYWPYHTCYLLSLSLGYWYS